MKLILTPAAAQRLRAHLESTGGAHLLPPQLRRVHKRLAKGISKEDRDAARRINAEHIRLAVFARANGRCECCNSRTPAELHHLVSGGLRRHRESEQTTAAVCAWCHVDLHKSKFHALQAMRRWATERHFTEALHAVEKRLAKLDEAKRDTEAA